MKVTTAIARILKTEGVEFLSCYPTNMLIDAAASEGIRPIICRQERVGINIADGYTRVSNGRRIGVFAMQHGPGAENAFPGVAQAFADSVPILLLPGGESRHRQGVPPVFSSVECYRPVTKWAAQINFADRIPELMGRAFSLLRTGRPRPVLVEVPWDLQQEEMEDSAFSYKPVKAVRYEGDPKDVAEAARMLLAAKRPVIWAGQGVLYAEAWDELRELVEYLQVPVLATLCAKSVIPEDHPLYLGPSSHTTTKAVVHFLQKADLVFGIGCSFTKTPFAVPIPPGKAIVHITNDPADVNKDYRADHAVIGDAKLVLQQLLAEVKRQAKTPRDGKDVQREIKAVREEFLKQWMPKLTSDQVPINPYRVVWDLMHTVDRKRTIITHDAGSPRDQTVPFWESLTPRGYLGWGKSTQLGSGLGLAMGAKLAAPDKLCINFMGDAAIGMVGMDFETAVRNKIPILTIVSDNAAMAIETSTLVTSTERYGARFLTGDYAGVAKALGGYAERVEKPQDIVPAIQRAMKVVQGGQPALLDFITCEETSYALP